MSNKKKRRKQVFSLDGQRCLRCGSSRDLEIDHVVPQAADGPSCWKNLQTLCLPCNRLKTDQPIDYRSPERRLTAEQKCGCGWEPPLVVRKFGKFSEQRQSIWEAWRATTGGVSRHTDRLSSKWVFAGTWVPISELFEKLNQGITLDEFLDCYEGIEKSDVEWIIDLQIERLQAVRSNAP
ncbi:MAG: HNH endonuclease [bacterium]|nr:HNH endonuclease [Acidimicrobiia bacterium]MCY4649932.1 HNH endonuclease [bacterium]